MTQYAVATVKRWNIDLFNQRTPDLPGEWTLFDDPKALTKEALDALQPRYIFFPHWSWIVPKPIVEGFHCVCFHMTDVPYGRGGSPLQNLIVRGHTETKLTALRMDDGLDTGPVYMKSDLSLEGTSAEILGRASLQSWDMIERLVREEPQPVAQTGEPVAFKRRKPSQGAIPPDADAATIYDYIRMLDGEGYPPAVIKHGDWTLHFTQASHDGDRVSANVVFKRDET